MIDSVVNFFHLLATVIWIGGMMFIQLVLQPSLGLVEPKEGGKLYGIVARRFSVTAWICVLVLLVTGYIKTPERMFFDFSYSPAIFLAVKHILVLLMIIVGLVIALHVVPTMRKNAPGPGEAPSTVFLRCQKRLGALAWTNVILGVLVLACASMLW